MGLTGDRVVVVADFRRATDPTEGRVPAPTGRENGAREFTGVAGP